jgi:hypothetical protein
MKMASPIDIDILWIVDVPLAEGLDSHTAK